MISPAGRGRDGVGVSVGNVGKQRVVDMPVVNTGNISTCVLAGGRIKMTEGVVQVEAVQEEVERFQLRVRGAMGGQWEGRPVQVRIQDAVEIACQDKQILGPEGRNRCKKVGKELATLLLVWRRWSINVDDVEGGLHVREGDGSGPPRDEYAERRGSTEGGAAGVDGYPIGTGICGREEGVRRERGRVKKRRGRHDMGLLQKKKVNV